MAPMATMVAPAPMMQQTTTNFGYGMPAATTTYVAPQPTFTTTYAPAPTFVQQPVMTMQPAFVQPTMTYVQPAPTFIAQPPTMTYTTYNPMF